LKARSEPSSSSRCAQQSEADGDVHTMFEVAAVLAPAVVVRPDVICSRAAEASGPRPALSRVTLGVVAHVEAVHKSE
jgi:hypothetical protein